MKGSKDALCPLEKLESPRKRMKSLSDLHVIDGGTIDYGEFIVVTVHFNKLECEEHILVRVFILSVVLVLLSIIRTL